ncbi:MAG: hypothetical protein IKG87_13950 [Clostridia bacterium]|nr:hypothetical protein [Clostridia bacterium]
MTDQMDGEWFLRMAGIGSLLPDERVKSILELILDSNFTPDGGLTNIGYPTGTQASLATYKNCQAEAVWTGIGYAAAALAISAGLKTSADEIVRSIHQNQIRFGAFWEHWECGFRYTRPLSSWTTMLAALGLKIDSEKRIIRLRPAEKDLIIPVCTCDFLGTAYFADGKCRIELTEGDLRDWRIISVSE